jgi:glycerol uptake facilitator-like aquaporin
LAGGNTAVALLANTLATVFALYVLIETIGPISGAHFNPVVSLVMAYRNNLARNHLLGSIVGDDCPRHLAREKFGAWHGARTSFG